jgi:adenine phosphoribosyltransferase
MKTKENALKAYICDIPDFPQKGVIFRDITPLLSNGNRFRQMIEALKKKIDGRVDYIVSIESRGFILGSALAYSMGIGFIPIRKAGKLPRKTFSQSYDLEYGRATIQIHRDAVKKGARVLIVDDVLATGGTARAAVKLAQKTGATVAGIYFLIELTALKGRQKLKGYPVSALMTY